MAFNVKKRLGTSKELEDGGVWVDLGEGARAKIRRRGNAITQEFMRKRLRPHRRAVELGTLGDDVMNAIIVDTIAHTLIVDWEGVSETITGADGKPILTAEGKEQERPLAFSVTNAKRLLRDVPDFRDLIWGYSESAEIFRVESEESDAKN